MNRLKISWTAVASRHPGINNFVLVLRPIQPLISYVGAFLTQRKGPNWSVRMFPFFQHCSTHFNPKYALWANLCCQTANFTLLWQLQQDQKKALMTAMDHFHKTHIAYLCVSQKLNSSLQKLAIKILKSCCHLVRVGTKQNRVLTDFLFIRPQCKPPFQGGVTLDKRT